MSKPIIVYTEDPFLNPQETRMTTTHSPLPIKHVGEYETPDYSLNLERIEDRDGFFYAYAIGEESASLIVRTVNAFEPMRRALEWCNNLIENGNMTTAGGSSLKGSLLDQDVKAALALAQGNGEVRE
jgi:hypothetical protein